MTERGRQRKRDRAREKDEGQGNAREIQDAMKGRQADSKSVRNRETGKSDKKLSGKKKKFNKRETSEKH